MNIQTKSVTRSWNYFSVSNKAREQRVGPRGKNFSCFSKNGHIFGGIHSNVVFEFSLGREETVLNSSFPSPPNLEDKVTECIVVPAPIVRGLTSRTALWSVWLVSRLTLSAPSPARRQIYNSFIPHAVVLGGRGWGTHFFLISPKFIKYDWWEKANS